MVERRRAERRIDTRGYGDERRRREQPPQPLYGGMERRSLQRRLRDRRLNDRRRSGVLDLPR
jgi:hypothetical protein